MEIRISKLNWHCHEPESLSSKTCSYSAYICIFMIVEHLQKHLRWCILTSYNVSPYLLYKFNKGSITAVVYIKYVEDAIDDSTCHWWLWKFRRGDRSYEDQVKCGHPSLFVKKILYQVVQNCLNLTWPELAETFNVHETTVQSQLEVLSFILAYCRSVRKVNQGLYFYALLIQKCIILDMDCNEKWVVYHSTKHQKIVF